MLFIITLILCGSMIVFGLWFRISPPKDINGVFGYRTRWSSLSQETWEYAHRFSGGYWLIMGSILLLLSSGYYLLTHYIPILTHGMIFIVWLQIIGMLLVIPLTEIALHKNFDSDGCRRK